MDNLPPKCHETTCEACHVVTVVHESAWFPGKIPPKCSKCGTTFQMQAKFNTNQKRTALTEYEKLFIHQQRNQKPPKPFGIIARKLKVPVSVVRKERRGHE